MPDQGEILEHHPDPAAKPGQPLARHRDDILAEQPDEAPARPLGEIEQLQQRGLARAGRARQKIETALAQREGQVGKRFSARPVAQTDIVELDDTACSGQNHLRSLSPLQQWHGESLAVKLPCPSSSLIRTPAERRRPAPWRAATSLGRADLLYRLHGELQSCLVSPTEFGAMPLR
jgi:hypothetical protein